MLLKTMFHLLCNSVSQFIFGNLKPLNSESAKIGLITYQAEIQVQASTIHLIDRGGKKYHIYILP